MESEDNGLKPKDKTMEHEGGLETVIDERPEVEYDSKGIAIAEINEDIKDVDTEIVRLANILYNNYLVCANATKDITLDELRTMVGDVNHSMYLMMVSTIKELRLRQKTLEDCEKKIAQQIYS